MTKMGCQFCGAARGFGSSRRERYNPAKLSERSLALETFAQVIGKGKRYLARAARPLSQYRLFPTELILHFGTHKAITTYYGQVMTVLGAEFELPWQNFYSNYPQFIEAVRTGRGKRIYELDDYTDIEWHLLPSFRGSHVVRDPRDLIVSGYHYHLWTNEAWCQAPHFYWEPVVRNPYFRYVESDPARFPSAESYQTYLRGLDPERGLILESVWRKHLFDRMRRWKPSAAIFESTYEAIVGNEVELFGKMFDHYGFAPRLKERGLQVVEQFSLKNAATGEQKHTRKGTSRQWVEEFTPQVKTLFKEMQGDLLIQLGYEKDLNW